MPNPEQKRTVRPVGELPHAEGLSETGRNSGQCRAVIRFKRQRISTRGFRTPGKDRGSAWMCVSSYYTDPWRKPQQQESEPFGQREDHPPSTGGENRADGEDRVTVRDAPEAAVSAGLRGARRQWPPEPCGGGSRVGCRSTLPVSAQVPARPRPLLASDPYSRVEKDTGSGRGRSARPK